MNEIHICPILMRTLILEDGEWIEECTEDCSITVNEKYKL